MLNALIQLPAFAVFWEYGAYTQSMQKSAALLSNQDIYGLFSKTSRYFSLASTQKFISGNDFFEMVDDFENKLEYAKQNTSLPDKPNYKAINEFVMSVNERIVKGEIWLYQCQKELLKLNKKEFLLWLEMN